MIRRPPRSTPLYSSAASDVYKRQAQAPKTTIINYVAEQARCYTLNGVATQLIVAGLREPVRSKIMEKAGLVTITDTINAAIELELIHSSQNTLTSALRVSEMTMKDDTEEVAALKRTISNLKKGNQNMGGGQTSGQANFSRDLSKVTCYYCHKLATWPTNAEAKWQMRPKGLNKNPGQNPI